MAAFRDRKQYQDINNPRQIMRARYVDIRKAGGTRLTVSPRPNTNVAHSLMPIDAPMRVLSWYRELTF